MKWRLCYALTERFSQIVAFGTLRWGAGWLDLTARGAA